MEKTEKRRHKTRLHYGVVFPSLDNTDKFNLLQDIENYANEHDLHLTAYFGSYATKYEDFASLYTPCFKAIKENKALDGVIIYSGFIAYNISYDEYVEYVKSISECFPIVSIGLAVPGTYCVMTDNMSGMYQAVSHLIKEDKRKNIVFIKGPDGHPEAEARFEGYLKALSDNGIERNDSLILPGDFTPNGGCLAMIELIDIRKAVFDAIAGCNDNCAIGAMRELKRRGYSLPRDVAVIGFDDIEEAAIFRPTLSSMRQDFSKLGIIAGEMLGRIIRKKQVEQVIYITPELITRRSCGCCKREKLKVPYIDDARNNERIRRNATDDLLLEFNLNSLGNVMRESLPSIFLDFALVGVYHFPIKITGEGERSIDLLFGFDGEQVINIKTVADTQFPFSDCSVIKGIDFERRRRTLFFLPLFSGDEEMGTVLIAYHSINPVNWYESLRTNIAAAVKGASLIEKIQTLSVTDELTGLLNRRGFLQQVRARLRYMQRESDHIHVIFVMDMDGLKRINDTYGHAEGDVSISAFAEILRASMRMEDIVSRLGGDEFAVYSVVKSENDISKLESRIRQNLDDYNMLKKHPYDIMGSIGIAILTKPTDASFDQAMLDADKILYAEKQKKKEKGLTRG